MLLNDIDICITDLSSTIIKAIPISFKLKLNQSHS